MSIVIRRAKESDQDAIAQLMVESFPRDFGETGSGALAAREWARERLTSKFAGVYVAERDGIVGYAIWIMLGGLSGIFEWDEIGVKSAERGRGVGLQLLREGEALFIRDVRDSWQIDGSSILLKSSNPGLIRLSRQVGYEEVAAIPRLFFGQPERILVKHL